MAKPIAVSQVELEQRMSMQLGQPMVQGSGDDGRAPLWGEGDGADEFEGSATMHMVIGCRRGRIRFTTRLLVRLGSSVPFHECQRYQYKAVPCTQS